MTEGRAFIGIDRQNGPSSQAVHLMMRYHAPLEDFDRHLKWVQQICREARINEVIFLIDPEEHFFGFPTLDRIRCWSRTLKHAGELLRSKGILMSLNPWVTLGHGARGYAPPKELGFTAMMTGDDGAVSLDTACPADPAWQRYLAESYALFASANPEILWLEDDHRLHNHGAVRFGCFAQPMLTEFAKRTGKLWEREDLVKAIVGGKGKTRAQWLQFTGDLWIENVARIREFVDKMNPNVKLAQMTSSMAAHTAEGRRWAEYLVAMSGVHRPITRPHFGPYRDTTGFDFTIGLTLFRHGLAFAGRGTRCCPELENWPFSYFSKSRRQTILALELTQFFGCRDLTFDFFSMTGNDPRNEPWVVQQINAARPRMDALAALGLDRRIERGVHVWTDERAAVHQKTEGKPLTMDSLFPAFDAWTRVFTRTGIASTFETRGSLTAVSGDTIRAADEKEIERLLRGGLLLDGRAAMALQEMGYGKHLGIRVERGRATGERCPISIERITDLKFGLKGSPVMGCGQMGFNWGDCRIYLHKLIGARATSEFQSGDQKPIGPAVTLFENTLGGRVAIYPFDFDSGVSDSVRFYNHPRKCQVQAVLRWLNRGQPILATPDPALLAVEQCSVDGMELLAMINLSGDPLDRFNLETSVLSGGMAMLDHEMKWRRLAPPKRQRNLTQVILPKPIEPFEACFLRW